MTKNMLYNREKKIAITYHDTTIEFILRALSVKDTQSVAEETQKIHAHNVALLTGATETLKSVYQLQQAELLVEAILLAEQKQYMAKAVLTLTGEEENYREKLAAKAEKIADIRRQEIRKMTKEELVEKLVSMELNRQIQAALFYAGLENALAKIVHDEKGKRLFVSADEMKDALPPAVLDKLYDEQLDFMAENGNAQVFLKPHTFVN